MGYRGHMLTNLKILWPPESPHNKVFLEVRNTGIDDQMSQIEYGEVGTC